MSKPIRVAFQGCGGFMGAHAQRLKKRDDVQLVALCDVSTDIVDAFITRNLADYPTKPAAYTNIDTLYREARPDAVFIATPHTLHFEHGMKAIDAGCHVFMEKPMVTSADDAHKLAAHVEKTDRILVVGYNSPCTPEFTWLRKAIRSKELGSLELVVAHLSQNWMKGTAGKWRQDPALSGGGQAYDSGAHLLNSLCWLVESDIDTVFAFVDNHSTPVDINSSINIRFANGVMASIVVSGNCPATGGHMALMFDQGKVEVDGWSGSWITVHKGKDKVKYPAIPGESCTPDDNFIDAIQGKTAPATTPRNGIIQSELMDAIYESARTGQPARPKRR